LEIPNLFIADEDIVGKKFFTDGKKTALIPNEQVLDRLSRLNCHTVEKAMKMDCEIAPENICSCHSGNTVANCICKNEDIMDIFTNPDLLMPKLVVNDSLLHAEGKELYVNPRLSTLQLEVTLKDFVAVNKIEMNSCIMTITSVDGCYSCDAGAVIQYSCKTDFGTALAHVDCGEIKFSANCDVTGSTKRIRTYFSSAEVKGKCAVSCPSGTSEAQLPEVQLHYVAATVEELEEQKIGKFKSFNFPDVFYLFKYFFTDIKNILFLVGTVVTMLVIIMLIVRCIPCGIPKVKVM